MPPEDEIKRRLRGARADYQVIDKSQVLMAGPDGEFKPLGFLSEDGFAWSADGGEHHGVDLSTNEPHQRAEPMSFATRNSYQTRIEPQLLEGARRVVKRSPLLDLIMGAPEREQSQLLRRLNMRWRDRIEPGIPKHARHVLAGPPEPGHYVYAKMADGQTIVGSMPAQDPITHHADGKSTYEFTIDPQRSKQDPAFNLTNPKG